jgi:hypothetical protein
MPPDGPGQIGRLEWEELRPQAGDNGTDDIRERVKRRRPPPDKDISPPFPGLFIVRKPGIGMPDY